ncbi:hypothetical protein FB451DRAFT_1167475 [Mycena latifolia]|nr:hypothetical protein FB451DRAFT_1167475 [Mycena latifolia]
MRVRERMGVCVGAIPSRRLYSHCAQGDDTASRPEEVASTRQMLMQHRSPGDSAYSASMSDGRGRAPSLGRALRLGDLATYQLATPCGWHEVDQTRILALDYGLTSRVVQIRKGLNNSSPVARTSLIVSAEHLITVIVWLPHQTCPIHLGPLAASFDLVELILSLAPSPSSYRHIRSRSTRRAAIAELPDGLGFDIGVRQWLPRFNFTPSSYRGCPDCMSGSKFATYPDSRISLNLTSSSSAQVRQIRVSSIADLHQTPFNLTFATHTHTGRLNEQSVRFKTLFDIDFDVPCRNIAPPDSLVLNRYRGLFLSFKSFPMDALLSISKFKFNSSRGHSTLSLQTISTRCGLQFRANENYSYSSENPTVDASQVLNPSQFEHTLSVEFNAVAR